MRPQASPTPASPTPNLAALSEQEPSPDGLQPRNKSAEPEAADEMALQTTSHASGSCDGASDYSYSEGSTREDCSDSDGDGDAECSAGSSLDSRYSDGGKSGSVSSVDGSGRADGDPAPVEAALPPGPSAAEDIAFGCNNPAGEGEDDMAEGSSGNGSAGAAAQVGAGNIANVTAQQLTSGEVSFSEFHSLLKKSAAAQAQKRVRGEGKGRAAGSAVQATKQAADQAADQVSKRAADQAANEEASRFPADLGCKCASYP